MQLTPVNFSKPEQFISTPGEAEVFDNLSLAACLSED